MRLDELARRIGAELQGDGSIEVTGVATLDQARPGHVSFLHNPRYGHLLQSTQASAVITGLRASSDRVALLKASNPYLCYSKAIVELHGPPKQGFTGTHRLAHVDPTATIGTGTIIHPFCCIGPNVKIGRDCLIYPNVTIYPDCVIGDRVIIHAGAVIGQDGFGYATDAGVHHKIPHIGNVVIEDDVEIGANTTIARAALGSTTIGAGTKIDALVAVGHNVRVGPGGMIVAQVGIAGSTVLGHHVTIGGQAGLAGHLKIGDGATIAAQASVMSNIEPQTTVIGSPAMPAMHARRVYSHFTDLPELVARLKKLEQQVEELGTKTIDPDSQND